MKGFIKAMAAELRQAALNKLTPEQVNLLPRCKLRLRSKVYGKGLYISGKIDGHEVRIDEDSGIINGGGLDEKTARRLWGQYYYIALFQDTNFTIEAKRLAFAKEAEVVAKTL